MDLEAFFKNLVKLTARINAQENNTLGNGDFWFDVDRVRMFEQSNKRERYSLDKAEKNTKKEEKPTVLNGFDLWRFERRIIIPEHKLDLMVFYLYQYRRYAVIKTKEFVSKITVDDEFYVPANLDALETRMKEKDKFVEEEESRFNRTGGDFLRKNPLYAQQIENNRKMQLRAFDLKYPVYFDEKWRVEPVSADFDPFIHHALWRVGFDASDVLNLNKETNTFARILLDPGMFLTAEEQEIKDFVWEFYYQDVALFLKASYYFKAIKSAYRFEREASIIKLADVLRLEDVNEFNDRLLTVQTADDELLQEVTNADTELQNVVKQEALKQKSFGRRTFADSDNNFLGAKFNLTQNKTAGEEYFNANELDEIFHPVSKPVSAESETAAAEFAEAFKKQTSGPAETAKPRVEMRQFSEPIDDDDFPEMPEGYDDDSDDDEDVD